MIVVTGGARTIGSAFIRKLIGEEYGDIIAVDETADAVNQDEKRISARLKYDELPEWIKASQLYIQFIFHLSEKSDIEYLKELWNYCVEFGLPFVFLADDASNQWVENQERKPYFWAGLKLSDIEAEDAAEVIYFMMHHRKDSGIYDLTEGREKLEEIGFHKRMGGR